MNGPSWSGNTKYIGPTGPAGSTGATGPQGTAGPSLSNWSPYPATTDVDMSNFNIVNAPGLANSGGTVTIAGSNISNTAVNKINLTADRGVDVLGNAEVNLLAQNGNHGAISLTANGGYNNGINGEVNITANGSTLGSFTQGGLINITANTPVSSNYTFTSAIKMGASSILSYAGSFSSYLSLAGYNYTWGQGGVNITCSPTPPSIAIPNTAGTVFISGYAGTKISNELYVDAIKNYNGQDLTISSPVFSGSNANISVVSGQALYLTATTGTAGVINMNGNTTNIQGNAGNLNLTGGSSYIIMNALGVRINTGLDMTGNAITNVASLSNSNTNLNLVVGSGCNINLTGASINATGNVGITSGNLYMNRNNIEQLQSMYADTTTGVNFNLFGGGAGHYFTLQNGSGYFQIADNQNVYIGGGGVAGGGTNEINLQTYTSVRDSQTANNHQVFNVEDVSSYTTLTPTSAVGTQTIRANPGPTGITGVSTIYNAGSYGGGVFGGIEQGVGGLLSLNVLNGGTMTQGLEIRPSYMNAYKMLNMCNNNITNIGTATAQKLIGTYGNTPIASVSALALVNGDPNSVTGRSQIEFQYNGGGYNHYIASRHNASSVNNNSNAIDFWLYSTTGGQTGSTAPNNGNVAAMSVTARGVGIFNITPTSALDVIGATSLNGTLNMNSCNIQQVNYISNTTCGFNVNTATGYNIALNAGGAVNIASGSGYSIGLNSPIATGSNNITSTYGNLINFGTISNAAGTGTITGYNLSNSSSSELLSGSNSVIVDPVNITSSSVGSIVQEAGSNSIVLPGASGFEGVIATGGTITTYGNRRVHQFTSNGAFTITANPLNQLIEVVCIGGGGGSGVNAGGGGGAGGYAVYSNVYGAGSYRADPGQGGPPGANGSNTTFNITDCVALGGGAGGDASSNGQNGGCGGGIDTTSAYQTQGTGSQGYNGGGVVPSGAGPLSGTPATGGGGIGGPADDALVTFPYGLPFASGLGSNIYGYDVGGGGAGYGASGGYGLQISNGGAYGGGQGGDPAVSGGSGTYGVGGTGGGGGGSLTGGTYGGSGVVIVSYEIVTSTTLTNTSGITLNAPNVDIKAGNVHVAGDTDIVGNLSFTGMNANLNMNNYDIAHCANFNGYTTAGMFPYKLVVMSNTASSTGTGDTWITWTLSNVPAGEYHIVAYAGSNFVPWGWASTGRSATTMMNWSGTDGDQPFVIKQDYVSTPNINEWGIVGGVVSSNSVLCVKNITDGGGDAWTVLLYYVSGVLNHTWNGTPYTSTSAQYSFPPC